MNTGEAPLGSPGRENPARFAPRGGERVAAVHIRIRRIAEGAELDSGRGGFARVDDPTVAAR